MIPGPRHFLRLVSSAGLALVLLVALALPSLATAQQADVDTQANVNVQLTLPIPKKLCEQLSKIIPVIDQYCDLLPGILRRKPKVKAKVHIHGGGGGGDNGVAGLQVQSTVSPGTARQLIALGASGEGVLRLPGVHRAKKHSSPALKPEIFNPISGLARPTSDKSSSWWIPIAAAIIIAVLSLLAYLRHRASGSGPPPTAGA